jgi:hypothetical protein
MGEALPGEDMLRAAVYGGSLDDMKMAALDEGARLWGPLAVMELVSVCGLATAVGSHRGRFRADIVVRRLGGPDWSPPRDDEIERLREDEGPGWLGDGAEEVDPGGK